MAKRSSGLSLVEILIALTFAGLLAVLTLPKFLVSDGEVQRSTVAKVEQIMEQLISITQYYANSRGIPIDSVSPIDLATDPYESIMTQYGNYLIKKPVTIGASTYYYFFLASDSRLTVNPQLFLTGTPLYSPAPLPVNKWRDYSGGTASSYCSQYNQNECLYLDLNGPKPPNAIGKGGDIIPIRINPNTGEVRTLYQWAIDPSSAATTQTNACQFVSAYDVNAKITGASACP